MVRNDFDVMYEERKREESNLQSGQQKEWGNMEAILLFRVY